MKNLPRAVAAALFGFAAIDPAGAATAQCVSCTDAQMYSLVRTLGAHSAAHIIWDPATGNVKRYRNYCGSAPNGSDPATGQAGAAKAGCNLQTEEQQVDANLSVVAAAMSEVWRQTGGTFKADFTANIGGITYPTYYPGKPTATIS